VRTSSAQSLYNEYSRSLSSRKRALLPAPVVPTIKLQGPKISRNLTTDWYAHRVDGRFQQCLKK